MKLTKQKLIDIIKEERASVVTMEGNLHSDGLRELISDFVAQEVSGWQTVAKASLHKEVAESGFDISDIVMNSLGGGIQEITKQQLVKIIKEELSVAEAYGDPQPPPSASMSWRQAMDKLLKFKAKLGYGTDLETELDEIIGDLNEAHGRSQA